MPVNKSCMRKLRESKITPEAITSTLQQISDANDMFGAGSTQIVLDYQGVDTPVISGDMIPVLTLGLRPVEVAVEEDKE
jgi:TctA family transporter